MNRSSTLFILILAGISMVLPGCGSTEAKANGSKSASNSETPANNSEAAGKAFPPQKFWQNGAKAKIQNVIDGDTVILDFEENIKTAHARLIGINTPEVKSPYTQEQCFGPQASARLKILVENEPEVYVLRGIEPLDRYDRLLVYLFRASDGKFINELMLEEGYAYFLSIPPNDTYRDVFKSAEASAKSQKRGLWTACEKFLK